MIEVSDSEPSAGCAGSGVPESELWQTFEALMAGLVHDGVPPAETLAGAPPHSAGPQQTGPSGDLSAGSPQGCSVRSFANEKVATFSEPGELGRTLAEGVSRGEYPKGMVNFFSNVKHTTNRGVFQKFRGIFPLPVAWPNLGRAPGDACSSPEVEAWLALVCHSLNRLAGVKKSAPRFRQGAQVQRVVGCLRNRIGRFLSLFRPSVVPPGSCLGRCNQQTNLV